MKEINLHMFIVDKFAMNLLQFFNLDSDYNGDNGEESYKYWEMSDQYDENGDLIPLAIVQGFKTEAERLLREWDDDNEDDHTRIGNILDKISEFCHGSYSYSFTYEILDIGNTYAVSVAFLTQ